MTAEQFATPEKETLQPLLLHSMYELRELWLSLLELAGVRSVMEIGSESGVTSELLIDRLHAAGGGRLVIVDPGAAELATPDDVECQVVAGFSPEALKGLAAADAYLVDGDHNYWTVVRELGAIAAAHRDSGHFPLVLLNDVSWPWARRDLYYAPDRLPPEAVRPHTFELGVVPQSPELQRSGFRGEGQWACAYEEGGPRNGVLTAVEDFLAEHPRLELHLVAPVFGLGVIVDREALWADAARTALAPYAGSPFLARLERNRTDLFVKLIEMQDLLADQQQRFAEQEERVVEAALRTARQRRADRSVHEIEIAAARRTEFELREQVIALQAERDRSATDLARVTQERDATQRELTALEARPTALQRIRSLRRRRRG